MGGCLWSFLPLLILLPLYAIIREPLIHMMSLTADQVELVKEALQSQSGMEFVKNGYEQLQMAAAITKDNLPQLAAVAGEGNNLFTLNFDFLGIDLSAMPTWKIWTDITNWSAVVGPFLLVIVSTLLSVVMGKVSSMTNKINQGTQAKDPNKTMMLMMPLMSLWIGFMMPAAMCIYWIANSVLSMVQELIAARMLKKDYEKARIASEERARQEKEDEKRRKEEARLERERRAAEEKQNKKKGIKKDTEPEQEGVNKDDSREGLRAHARGRAYIPDRFGGVTEYTDPDKVVIAP
jgi:YidC/Oxa1 family membrane protein insertase